MQLAVWVVYPCTIPVFIIWITCLLDDSVASLVYKYTAVPPSPNPKSKLSQAFRIELENLVDAVQRFDEGRAWFDISTPTIIKLHSLNARSIRIVAAEYLAVEATSDDDNIEDTLASYMLRNSQVKNIQNAIAIWEQAGNSFAEQEPISFSITAKKWNSFVLSEVSPSSMRRSLTNKMADTFDWNVAPNGEAPTFKFHLLLFESSVILELVLLDRPTKTFELPKPGFKRVESFALTKSIDIQPEDVVIDPMCGKGTFLVEAATIWPSAKYYGMDTSLDQLQNAKENIEATNVAVELQPGVDARNLSDWKDSSVDKIVCCPPFGRQFEKDSDALYEDLMREWSRVLKATGRMGILIDKSNVQSMMEAIQKANCHVDQCRTPSFRLGNIRATILVVSKLSSTKSVKEQQKETEFGPLWWEQEQQTNTNQPPGRSLWTAMRAEALPSLVPYSYKRSIAKQLSCE
ncbi:unnamed protein product [Cylindrotheca closterium]|uniref:Ribosomal RNA large subunit methyltransferase K/L-like methyltransferase domain-containing protein n=1 Tax=Cylindrotheca closterium TaxID=2856 RepID=A0AAD2GAG9_9STRA|nr:unnamed protein product [Cylindrotheca closterium]